MNKLFVSTIVQKLVNVRKVFYSHSSKNYYKTACPFHRTRTIEQYNETDADDPHDDGDDNRIFRGVQYESLYESNKKRSNKKKTSGTKNTGSLNLDKFDGSKCFMF